MSTLKVVMGIERSPCLQIFVNINVSSRYAANVPNEMPVLRHGMGIHA